MWSSWVFFKKGRIVSVDKVIILKKEVLLLIIFSKEDIIFYIGDEAILVLHSS